MSLALTARANPRSQIYWGLAPINKITHFYSNAGCFTHCYMPRNKSKILQKRIQSYASGIKTSALITTLSYVLSIVQNTTYLPLHEKLLNFTNIFRFTKVFPFYLVTVIYRKPLEKLKLSYVLYEKSILLRSYPKYLENSYYMMSVTPSFYLISVPCLSMIA
jgi:hypothetical protein